MWQGGLGLSWTEDLHINGLLIFSDVGGLQFVMELLFTKDKEY